MLTVSLSISSSNACADPESIIRNAIAALSRFEAIVPAGQSERAIHDDNGHRIGRLVVVNELEG
jgi:hypothetical protein